MTTKGAPPGQESPIRTWRRGMAEVALIPTGDDTAVVEAATQWSEHPHHYGDVAAVDDGTYETTWTGPGLSYLGPDWCDGVAGEIDAAMRERVR